MMHVRDLGSGPPVVLLHPGPGLDGSVFRPVMGRPREWGELEALGALAWLRSTAPGTPA